MSFCCILYIGYCFLHVVSQQWLYPPNYFAHSIIPLFYSLRTVENTTKYRKLMHKSTVSIEEYNIYGRVQQTPKSKVATKQYKRHRRLHQTHKSTVDTEEHNAPLSSGFTETDGSFCTHTNDEHCIVTNTQIQGEILHNISTLQMQSIAFLLTIFFYH